jgi:hypothetical protein
MVETAIKHKRVALVFLVIAVVGSLLTLLAEPGSKAADLGAVLLAVWIVPLSFFVFFFAKKRARLIPMPLTFDADEAFVPHVSVNLTLTREQDGGRKEPITTKGYCGIFVVGTQGFTARFRLPSGVALGASTPKTVDVQFLRPEVALSHFAVGTSFTMLEGRRTVGTGEVVDVLGTPTSPDLESFAQR